MKHILQQVVAGLLDAAEWPGDFTPRGLPIAREWIERAPAARAQLERLEACAGGEPSLFDLACLLWSVETLESFPECWDTALWLVHGSAAGQALWAPLEHTAEVIAGELGSPRGQLAHVLQVEHQLDQLVEDDAWVDPSDRLDPMRQTGIEVAQLLLLCEDRLSQEPTEDRAERLRTVRDRLRGHQVVEKGAQALHACRGALVPRLRGEDTRRQLPLESLAWVTAAIEILTAASKEEP